jgi:hypothetical protein
MLDYGARLLDPLTGRWNGVDALAEKFHSSGGYNYVLGNPVRNIDPDGRTTYVDKNNLVLDVVNDGSTDIVRFNDIDYSSNKFCMEPGCYSKRSGGEVIGKTLYWYDFMELNEQKGTLVKPMYGTKIDNPLQFSAEVRNRAFATGLDVSKVYSDGKALLEDLHNDFLESSQGKGYYRSLYYLATQSASRERYDIKTDESLAMGSQGYLYDAQKKIYTTGRALGNIVFGMNARSIETKQLIPGSNTSGHWYTVMKPSGLYNMYSNSTQQTSGNDFYGEHPYSGSFIWYGFWGFGHPGY